MQMKNRSMMLALAAGFAIFATPLGASAATVVKIGTTEYETVDAAMEAAAASGTATTVTLLADSTDSTVVPTWYIQNDITIDAASPVKATISPTVNAEGVGDGVGGLAYLTSADAANVRTVTVGENVTLSFPRAKDGLNAFYIGRNGSDAFVPVNLVLNGCVEAYLPYLGAQSTLTISKTGSLKAEWNECLQTRWGSSLTVTGTDGGWSAEKPQVSLAYVNQRGGEITFKDTFVKIGLTWGGNWTINNSNNKTDCATKLTLDNASLDGVSRFTGDGTSAYEVELKNKAKLTIKTDYAGSAGSGYFKNISVGVVKIEAGSLISAVSVENAGKFVVDATGITEATKVFDYTGADTLTLESYGTVEVTGGTAYVEENDLYVKPSSVAKIGSVEYTSLAAAFAAAKSGDTVTLLADLTEPEESKSIPYIIYDMAGVTFDLNGHTYSSYNSSHAFQGTGGVIKNGSMVCLDGGSYALFIGDEGETTSFTVENVTMTGGVNIYNATGVVLKNLNVMGTKYYAVWLDAGAEATIESGTYQTSDNSTALLNGDPNSYGLAVEGGTFKANGKPLMGTTGGSLAISGGTFDAKVDEKYCAEGHLVQTQNADGTYGVEVYFVKVGNDGYYKTLAAAIGAAKSGDTITLLTDVMEMDARGGAIPYTVTGVTLDLNGHTYTQYNYAHVFQGTGGVIKNGKIVCAPAALDTNNGNAYGSYALFIGYHVDDKTKELDHEPTAATTSFLVKDVEMIGGINISHATDVVLENVTVQGTNYRALWTEEGSTLTVKSGTYTAGVYNVLDGEKTTTITIEGGTFKAGEKVLVGTNGLTLSLTGGKFDKPVDSKYLNDGIVSVLGTDGYYELAKGEKFTVKAKADDATATVNLALSETVIAKVKESLPSGSTTTVAEKLNAKAENNLPTWVNIVAGIDETKDVSVATANNADTNTIDLGLSNITAGADVGANVEIAYEIDEVDASGNVEKTGEVKSSAAIDVAAVESNAIFSVKVLVRQNGTTLATVPATKLVGVQKTTRKAKKTIISVPWHSLADDANISVAELVMTSNLTEGDKLYVYNVTEKRYDVYTLNASKTWTPTAIYTIDENGQMSATTSGTPDGTKIARGSGVWLERQDTSTPIISYGQATNVKQETAMAAGTKEEPKWSLAAVPSTESVALETIAPTASSADDKVIVPTDGAPKIFTVENGAWGYSETVEITNKFGEKGVKSVRKTDTKLEPGTGFWYLNAGDAKTVNW